MGFFNNFKNDKKATIKFEEVVRTPEPYDPWKRTNLPRNDDYAIAAFIWFSMSGKKIGVSNDDYPRYFSYDFRVYDPLKYHKKVINEGYLSEASPNIPLERFKVDQLKAILDNHGLPSKGKKADLISRIIDNVDVSALNLDTYYVPSEKGMEHFAKYGYVMNLRNYGISWEEYDSIKKNYPEYMKPNDIIWRMLNDRLNYCNINKSYGSARSELHYMSKLLESEKKYVDSLSYLILYLYYATSGMGNNNMVEDLEYIVIAPGIVEKIHGLKDYYDERMIERCYSRFKLPRHYLKKANFEKLISDIFDDKSINIKKYV